ncbi:O-antigen ligase family protein [Devosia epidermidihirudinis]|uniref:O-antigen ligase family protein n=1 Tax=Devosia epidermidihirudinis TaxID=1293439 RepID=UPI0006983358|nr:O-antigen ligase family protein [Devosia epidermidihirudinis]
MLIPWQFYIGPLHLSATRAVLLIALVPCLVKWTSGQAGPIRMPDIAVLLFIVWCGIATMQIEGAGYAVQSVGMLLIETAGAYFLARVYIRTEDDFYALSRALFWVMALLLPFAFLEAITKQPVLMDLFGRVMRTYDIAGSDPRWGMRRAQTVFQHPILYGVFCGIAFAPTALVLTYGRPLIERGAMVVIVVAAAFFSLSSGPMTALALQIALVCWNYVLKGFPGRWKLFWGILAFVYLFVSVFSHQSPAEHLINLVAFDKGSAWQRLLIWNYGTGSIAAHPVFGVGFGDWARMDGQTSSVDMFWIISSLRHGILAGVFLAMVYLGAALMVGFRKGLSPAQLRCRTAYLVALAGFFVAGWTVDFWGEVYTAFFFMIGSGLWLLTATGEEHESEEMPACQRNLRPRRVIPARQR